MRVSLFLALRYLRARRISYLAILAIALSLGTILTVLYVLWGLSQEFQKQVRGALPDLTVRFSSAYGLVDYDGVLQRIRGIEGVEAASPVLEQWVLVERERDHTPARLVGVDVSSESKVVDLAKWFGGEPPDLAAPEGGKAAPAALGTNLSENLWLSPGSRFTLVSAVFSSPSSVAPTYPTLGRGSYEVGAVFRSWDFLTDQYSILVSLQEAQRLLRRYQPAAITGVKVRVLTDASVDLDDVRNKVKEAIAAKDPQARVLTWREMNPQGLSMVDAENRVMFVILSSSSSPSASRSRSSSRPWSGRRPATSGS